MTNAQRANPTLRALKQQINIIISQINGYFWVSFIKFAELWKHIMVFFGDLSIMYDVWSHCHRLEHGTYYYRD